MKDYTYGDKVDVNYNPNNHWDKDYKWNQYQSINNKNTDNNPNNKRNKRIGWGTQLETLLQSLIQILISKVLITIMTILDGEIKAAVNIGKE
jgi:hypothetical protein